MRPTIILAAVALTAGTAFAEPSVERGKYLVEGPAGCGNCHSPHGPKGPLEGRALSGQLVVDIEPFTAVASNITPASRIADWTDAELVRAIREGIRPDGSVIGPPMPFAVYRGLGDDDVMSMAMYLRTVPPVENDPGSSDYRMPLPPAYGPPVGQVTPPERGPTVEYGAYLAGPVAHCTECHSPFGKEGPLLDTDLGRGGFEFPGPWGVSVAPNITSHADGLAGYSDDELTAMIVEGRRPDGSPMMPPMPYHHFARMTPGDLEALLKYLRTIPPLPDKG